MLTIDVDTIANLPPANEMIVGALYMIHDNGAIAINNGGSDGITFYGTGTGESGSALTAEVAKALSSEVEIQLTGAVEGTIRFQGDEAAPIVVTTSGSSQQTAEIATMQSRIATGESASAQNASAIEAVRAIAQNAVTLLNGPVGQSLSQIAADLVQVKLNQTTLRANDIAQMKSDIANLKVATGEVDTSDFLAKTTGGAQTVNNALALYGAVGARNVEVVAGGALKVTGDTQLNGNVTVAKKAMFTTGLNAGNNVVNGVAQPTAGTDAANKTYVDGAVANVGNTVLKIVGYVTDDPAKIANPKAGELYVNTLDVNTIGVGGVDHYVYDGTNWSINPGGLKYFPSYFNVLIDVAANKRFYWAGGPEWIDLDFVATSELPLTVDSNYFTLTDNAGTKLLSPNEAMKDKMAIPSKTYSFTTGQFTTSEANDNVAVSLDTTAVQLKSDVKTTSYSPDFVATVTGNNTAVSLSQAVKDATTNAVKVSDLTSAGDFAVGLNGLELAPENKYEFSTDFSVTQGMNSKSVALSAAAKAIVDNAVTTNTAQTITGRKTFTEPTVFDEVDVTTSGIILNSHMTINANANNPIGLVMGGRIIAGLANPRGNSPTDAATKAYVDSKLDTNGEIFAASAANWNWGNFCIGRKGTAYVYRYTCAGTSATGVNVERIVGMLPKPRLEVLTTNSILNGNSNTGNIFPLEGGTHPSIAYSGAYVKLDGSVACLVLNEGYTGRNVIVTVIYTSTTPPTAAELVGVPAPATAAAYNFPMTEFTKETDPDTEITTMGVAPTAAPIVDLQTQITEHLTDHEWGSSLNVFTSYDDYSASQIIGNAGYHTKCGQMGPYNVMEFYFKANISDGAVLGTIPGVVDILKMEGVLTYEGLKLSDSYYTNGLGLLGIGEGRFFLTADTNNTIRSEVVGGMDGPFIGHVRYLKRS
jgi:hypothetical protein